MGRADIATLPRLSPGVRLCLHPRALVGSAYDGHRHVGTPDWAFALLSHHVGTGCAPLSGNDRASREGHLITHTSARSVVTGSQRNGRTSAQLSLGILSVASGMLGSRPAFVVFIGRPPSTGALDRRQRLFLLAMVVTYFVIVALVFFLLPIYGMGAVVEVLGVYILVFLGVLLFASRVRKRPKESTKS